MPHLTARMPEAQLAGREQALITALTDAVTEVYGQAALTRPGGREIAGRLVAGLTDAVASSSGSRRAAASAWN